MKKQLIVFALLAFGMAGTIFCGKCVAQSPGPAPARTVDTLETVKEYLLTSAASDFYEHQPPFPARFRRVRLGRVGKVGKDASYRLCGEFFPANEGSKAKWIGFATIKTSKYEQYLGPTMYCSDTKMIWAKTGDLSLTLKKRLDALKSKGTGM
ncbi:MAG: hypothetical protein ABI878_02905 [Acidobacteriota bacterium]